MPLLPAVLMWLLKCHRHLVVTDTQQAWVFTKLFVHFGNVEPRLEMIMMPHMVQLSPSLQPHFSPQLQMSV